MVNFIGRLFIDVAMLPANRNPSSEYGAAFLF